MARQQRIRKANIDMLVRYRLMHSTGNIFQPWKLTPEGQDLLKFLVAAFRKEVIDQIETD